MNNAKSSAPPEGDLNLNRLPAPGIPVIVRRANCRCMAVRDRDGKWRDYFHRDVLSDVLEVLPLQW